MSEGILLLWCVFVFLFAIFKILGFFLNDKKIVLFPPKRLIPEEELFLEKNFKYYFELIKEDKELFSKRVTKFLKTVEFEGRKGLLVTRDMKLLIAATAIKLTFGFEVNYLIEGLNKIIIYPEEYYSNLTKTYNKGETNSAGFIVFSWKGFLQGLQNDHDNINLGFHEFAHAFINAQLLNFPEAYNALFETLKQEHVMKDLKEAHLLRNYAYTNKMEFMACVIETFFESPDQIFQVSPLLYRLFSDLLHQDPLNKNYFPIYDRGSYFDE